MNTTADPRHPAMSPGQRVEYPPRGGPSGPRDPSLAPPRPAPPQAPRGFAPPQAPRGFEPPMAAPGIGAPYVPQNPYQGEDDLIGLPSATTTAWRDRVVRRTISLVIQRLPLCIGLVVATAAAGGLVTLRIKPFYIASSTIYPSASSSPLSAFGMADVAGLVGNLGFGNGASSQFPMYEKVLFSRELVTQLLETPLEPAGARGTLLDHLDIREPDRQLRQQAAIDAVRLGLSYDTDKKTALVSVGYRDSDPKIAAEVANRAVYLLDHFDVSTSSSQAGERRKFLAAQLVDTKKRLSEAETRLEGFKQQNLRIGNAPSLQLDQARLERELAIDQEVYLTLRKQLEMAQIEEQQTMPVVNILDRAVPPVLPSGPSLVRNVALAGFAGALLALGLCVLQALEIRQLLGRWSGLRDAW